MIFPYIFFPFLQQKSEKAFESAVFNFQQTNFAMIAIICKATRRWYRIAL